MQLAKTEGGIKVRTEHGEEIVADVVLFATGNPRGTLVFFFIDVWVDSNYCDLFLLPSSLRLILAWNGVVIIC